MNLKLISWNIRGLNRKDKRLQVRNALKMWKADMICLQEVNMELINREVVRSLWSRRFVGWEYLEAGGTAGGILLMRDTMAVKSLEFNSSVHDLLQILICTGSIYLGIFRV